MLNAFPIFLRNDVEVVIDFLLDKNFDIHPTVKQEIILSGEQLIIPGRVYFDELKEGLENNLTDIQQTILNCIYLRHHNGFVRQKRLEKLKNNTEYFVTPFVFHLLGEYVIEIIQAINDQTKEVKLSNFTQFVEENPKYWIQTESRMISYWNEYYRRPTYPKIKNYVGYEIMKRIKNEHTIRYKLY
jgi:hypothetical protein